MTVKIKIFVLLFTFWQHSCHKSVNNHENDAVSSDLIIEDSTLTDNKMDVQDQELKVGAERMNSYMPFLSRKRVGLVVNQTSMVNHQHLVDALNRVNSIDVKTIFAPEHGFRGTADAGEKVENGIDPKTGVKVVSLYGKHKAPSAEELADIDVIIFDIQDVGARFYTYISTLHYVMKAAAENNVKVMILDRPNPNGHYVDGPILDLDYQSFVGMHPVPIVHGMTVGEYAQMINGEGWLGNGLKADLMVIRCENYTHNTPYVLPIPPSPNLPNNRSIYLYPSLCFFEGTVFSVGRGTNTQFQIYGHPDFSIGGYTFTPLSGPGSKYPKHENKACYGISLVSQSAEKIRSEGQINLFYLIQAYQHFPDKGSFFLKNHFIDKLAGSSQLREQIVQGLSQEEIRASWQEGLQKFKITREQYLIYE